MSENEKAVMYHNTACVFTLDISFEVEIEPTIEGSLGQVFSSHRVDVDPLFSGDRYTRIVPQITNNGHIPVYSVGSVNNGRKKPRHCDLIEVIRNSNMEGASIFELAWCFHSLVVRKSEHLFEHMLPMVALGTSGKDGLDRLVFPVLVRRNERFQLIKVCCDSLSDTHNLLLKRRFANTVSFSVV